MGACSDFWTRPQLRWPTLELSEPQESPPELVTNPTKSSGLTSSTEKTKLQTSQTAPTCSIHGGDIPKTHSAETPEPRAARRPCAPSQQHLPLLYSRTQPSFQQRLHPSPAGQEAEAEGAAGSLGALEEPAGQDRARSTFSCSPSTKSAAFWELSTFTNHSPQMLAQMHLPDYCGKSLAW